LRNLAEIEFNASPSRDSSWLNPWLNLSLSSHGAAHAKLDANLSGTTAPAIRALIAFVNQPPTSRSADLAHGLAFTEMPSPLLARIRWELLWRSGEDALARNAVLRDAEILGDFEANLALAITIDDRVNEIDYLKFWQDLINTIDIGPTHIERIAAIGLNSSRRLPLSLLRTKIPSSDRTSLSALWVLAVYQNNDSLRQSLEKQLSIEQEPWLTELTAHQLNTNLFLITSILPIPREVLYGITLAATLPTA
jgi:hypothetical protein